ncbi:hypothetical protein Ddc_06645 [Ditylenchus destructor]|nr:hypothetical protein Ddc_06645 [Ditylenchus destructor]
MLVTRFDYRKMMHSSAAKDRNNVWRSLESLVKYTKGTAIPLNPKFPKDSSSNTGTESPIECLKLCQKLCKSSQSAAMLVARQNTKPEISLASRLSPVPKQIPMVFNFSRRPSRQPDTIRAA